MNLTYSARWWSILVLGMFSLSYVFAAQETQNWPEPMQAATITVPDGLEPGVIQRAIVRAAIGRGWTVAERGDERVVLILEQGGWRSKLNCTFTTSAIAITSQSGKVDKNGVIKKPAVPESWVSYLKRDITAILVGKSK